MASGYDDALHGLDAWLPQGFFNPFYVPKPPHTTEPLPNPVFEAPLRPEPKGLQTGYRCNKCGSFNEYATANQEDGTYLCYECR